MSVSMIKTIVVLVLVSLLFTSCDPELDCTQPRCKHSDVYPNSPIIATLSGKMDSLINIGDTFKVLIKIPETLKTNYGDLQIKNIQAGSFFFLNYSGVTPFYDDVNRADFKMDLNIIKGTGPQANQNFQQMGWDLLNREYEAYFIPTRKGKYILEIKNSRTEVKTKDEKEWLVNLDIQFQQGRPFRVEQYRDFLMVDSNKATVTYSSLKDIKDYRYWFEVK